MNDGRKDMERDIRNSANLRISEVENIIARDVRQSNQELDVVNRRLGSAAQRIGSNEASIIQSNQAIQTVDGKISTVEQNIDDNANGITTNMDGIIQNQKNITNLLALFDCMQKEVQANAARIYNTQFYINEACVNVSKLQISSLPVFLFKVQENVNLQF